MSRDLKKLPQFSHDPIYSTFHQTLELVYVSTFASVPYIHENETKMNEKKVDFHDERFREEL